MSQQIERSIPALDSSELKELTEKLITACHILDHEGVTDGYGHISVRVPECRGVYHHRQR